ncbi:hypothetical protein Q8F55_002844 [Vanrija albida]|uniref:AB hydrolase-1 domain-containing protein n=1 Tax=Vanrija albida TaxID=181172 RepID=A0ABR3QB27_9TREE
MAPAKPVLPAIPSNKSQDPAHVMDFPTLNLGYEPCSKKEMNMVDLDINVFGLDEIVGSTKPIAVVIVSHGWANKAAQMENFASGMFHEIRRLGAEGKARVTRDVIIVTLDQRNHGKRRLKKDQLSYKNNPLRLTAMATTLKGGAQDHQLIMAYLEDYLFPHGERHIAEYMATGVSLGGHLLWRLMKEDPRIRVAVPIISCPPDSLVLVHTAHWRANGTLGTNAMYYPKHVREFYEDSTPDGVWVGRKILALHGDLDQVVPPVFSEASWPKVVAEAGRDSTEQVIQPGVGHICTPEMVRRASEWFYRWGACADAERGAKL